MKLNRPLSRVLTSWLLLATGTAALAQGLSDAQIDAERERIGAQRRVIDARHAQERAACYQRFAVEDCLRESRRRLRDDTDDLRRQETMLNDMQRKRRGAEQLERLEAKQAAPAAPDAQQRQSAAEGQRAREERAAENARSRAGKAAEAAQNRADFESRQQERADHAASVEQRRAQEPEARERFKRKQADALKRREERARLNAEKEKAPAAPLPAPVR
ncbi:hypothetical protein PGB34_07160 [Xenophilus arseniciresistens]|uniref:Uncharacterized protein n=1 Tax=Xenophilus arseniciresistens TaxID=1283306 RepID=A0AAE3N7S2_9BURK|nr:hypothetical protein [Xenophilus arseniciresistens]MDA7416143.1 hypothetical protein [Xenophilus arseniciresistens]